MIFPQFFPSIPCGYTGSFFLFFFLFIFIIFFRILASYISYLYACMQGRLSIFVYKQLNHAQLFAHNNKFFFITRGGTLRDAHIYHFIHNTMISSLNQRALLCPYIFFLLLLCVLCLHIIITQDGNIYDEFYEK